MLSVLKLFRFIRDLREVKGSDQKALLVCLLALNLMIIQIACVIQGIAHSLGLVHVRLKGNTLVGKQIAHLRVCLDQRFYYMLCSGHQLRLSVANQQSDMEGYPVSPQSVVVTKRVTELVGFSVEVILTSLVQ
jgi:hypothetical protein